MSLSDAGVSALIVAGIEQNAIDPGAEGRLAFKISNRTVHLEKGFLDGIFGVGLRTQHMEGNTFHTRSVDFV